MRRLAIAANGFRMHYEDQPHMIGAGEEAAKRVPGARKIVYPGAGHLIDMEQRKRFNRDLQAFLGLEGRR